MRAGPALACCAAALIAVSIAHADGALPPQPYHYLHPPAALAGNNITPYGTQRVLPVDYMRSARWTTFTLDGQAGLAASVNSVFAVAPSAKAVLVAIKPVESPPGLPAQLVVDGNAYNITATQQPGHAPANLVHSVYLTLRWPHLPVGIYQYTGGSWRQVCSYTKAILTATTISCATSTLGVFAAVTTGTSTSGSAPATPLSRLNVYIPIIVAALLIVLAIVAGYIVTRPHRKSDSGNTS